MTDGQSTEKPERQLALCAIITSVDIGIIIGYHVPIVNTWITNMNPRKLLLIMTMVLVSLMIGAMWANSSAATSAGILGNWATSCTSPVDGNNPMTTITESTLTYDFGGAYPAWTFDVHSITGIGNGVVSVHATRNDSDYHMIFVRRGNTVQLWESVKDDKPLIHMGYIQLTHQKSIPMEKCK